MERGRIYTIDELIDPERQELVVKHERYSDRELQDVTIAVCNDVEQALSVFWEQVRYDESPDWSSWWIKENKERGFCINYVDRNEVSCTSITNITRKMDEEKIFAAVEAKFGKQIEETQGWPYRLEPDLKK